MYSESQPEEKEHDHEPGGTLCYDCFRGMNLAFFAASMIHPLMAVGALEKLKLELLDSLDGSDEEDGE